MTFTDVVWLGNSIHANGKDNKSLLTTQEHP